MFTIHDLPLRFLAFKLWKLQDLSCFFLFFIDRFQGAFNASLKSFLMHLDVIFPSFSPRMVEFLFPVRKVTWGWLIWKLAEGLQNAWCVFHAPLTMSFEAALAFWGCSFAQTHAPLVWDLLRHQTSDPHFGVDSLVMKCWLGFSEWVRCLFDDVKLLEVP